MEGAGHPSTKPMEQVKPMKEHNWDKITKQAKKDILRAERARREQVTSRLESILIGWPGIEAKPLPLYGDELNEDPREGEDDYFFRPMEPVTIQEHPLFLFPADDSVHGAPVDGQVGGEGEASVEAVDAFPLQVDHDGDFLMEDELEDSEAEMAVDIMMESEGETANEDWVWMRLEDSEADAFVGMLYSETLWGEEGREEREELEQSTDGSETLACDYPYAHFDTARRIAWHFTEGDRTQFPNEGDELIQLINLTKWKTPSELPNPENVFGRYTDRIPTEETAGQDWFVRNAWTLPNAPHEMFIVANPRPENFHGGLVHGEVMTILTAMVSRYKKCRPYIRKEKVMPIMLISTIGTEARIIQAYYDGTDVVARVSRLIDPETVLPQDGYELFARYLACEPVGDTSNYPHEQRNKRTWCMAGLADALFDTDGMDLESLVQAEQGYSDKGRAMEDWAVRVYSAYGGPSVGCLWL
ncbi:hypothetical protein BJX76DRAFT_359609 [Aspergillus varians]